jgi:4,5-dihydroxyphthalate decarboxylase
VLNLSASLTPDALTRAIADNAVPIDGVELKASVETSVDKNSKKMLAGLFDIAEMSLATFVRARLEGFPIVALPIFTGRRFLHPAIWCSRNAHISRLEELRGKRVGVPQFWMTSSVWHRGILQEHHGISQDQVTWVASAPERLASLSWPQGVTVERAAEGLSPPELLNSGAVDCLMLPKAMPATFDWVSPFADIEQAQLAYYRATQVFPIMHLVVMSQPLATAHPDLPARIVSGFLAAKALAPKRKPIATLSDAQSEEIFGADPWPYGIEKNWRSISAFLGYARAQGLFDRTLAPADLFVGLEQ